MPAHARAFGLSCATLAAAALVAVTAADPAQARPDTLAGTWQTIGPYSRGGQMTTFRDDKQRMIVTVQNSRFYFETGDAGKTWAAQDRIPVANGRLLQVVADPLVPQRLWAVVTSNGLDPSYVGRLFVSDDSGARWRQLPAPDRGYRHLAVHASGQILVAAANAAGGASASAQISRDGGQSWTDSGVISSTFGPSALVGDALFLSTREGIVEIPDVRDPASRPRTVFSGSGGSLAWMRGVAGDNRVVVADTMFEGVWASTDLGATWRQIRPYRLGTSLVKVSDGEIIVGYTEEVQLSADLGVTWQVQADPWPATFAIDAVRWGTGGTLHLSAPSAGVYRLGSAGFQRIGVPAAQAFDIAVTSPAAAASVLAVGTEQDVYRTSVAKPENVPASPEWGESGGEGINGISAIRVAAGGGTLYKVIEDGLRQSTVYRSDDGGLSWHALIGPSPAIVHSLLVHPADPSLVAVSVTDTGGPAIWASRDGGTKFGVTPLPQPLAELAADPADPLGVYGAGPGGLFVSRDRATTFGRINSQPGDHVAVSPDGTGRLVMSSGTKLFSSPDGGRTLVPAVGTGAGQSGWISDFAYSPTDPKVVVAGTSAWVQGGRPQPASGVLRSDDGGQSWRPFAIDLPVLDVRAVAFHPTGTHVYAVTAFAGAYAAHI